MDPEIARIKLTRNGVTNEIWYQDLFDDPRLDIPLRAGDRIVLEVDTREFTILGATGQGQTRFDKQSISAIEALAQSGGLNSSAADPTGVFIFRNEPESIARNVVGRFDLQGTQRVVYVLDLTRPNGIFIARDFEIRDGDTIYVTEAAIVSWNKTISAITGTLGGARALETSASGLAN